MQLPCAGSTCACKNILLVVSGEKEWERLGPWVQNLGFSGGDWNSWPALFHCLLTTADPLPCSSAFFITSKRRPLRRQFHVYLKKLQGNYNPGTAGA